MRRRARSPAGKASILPRARQQQPMGRPRADAAQSEEAFGRFFVGEEAQALQVKGAVDHRGGHVEDVFRLAVAQLDASEAGYAIGEEGCRGREGVVGVAIVGHGGGVALQEQAADDSGHVGGYLLAENGLDEGFEDGGGLADVEAVELFNQGGKDGVPASAAA